MSDCMICFDKLPQKNTFRFQRCGHQFCLPCIRETFEGKIKSKMVSQDNFVCPQCNQPFDVCVLKNIVSPDIFKKYCDFAVDTHQIKGLKQDEIFIRCLNKKCGEYLIIWKGAEYQVCPICKEKYCRKCFLPFHEPQTCQWAIQENEKLLKDQHEQQLMKNFKMAKCPYCQVMVEKQGGCNHIRCLSQFCQGKQHFCYTCSAKLTADFALEDPIKHYEHWKDHSPHSSICKIWYQNRWTLKELVPQEYLKKLEEQKSKKNENFKIKILEVKHENAIPCPMCKSTNPEVTKLLQENSLIFCKSQTCKERWQCLQCLELLEEGDINDHFDLLFRCKMR